jgi:hypothetical protein
MVMVRVSLDGRNGYTVFIQQRQSVPHARRRCDPQMLPMPGSEYAPSCGSRDEAGLDQERLDDFLANARFRTAPAASVSDAHRPAAGTAIIIR